MSGNTVSPAVEAAISSPTLNPVGQSPPTSVPDDAPPASLAPSAPTSSPTQSVSPTLRPSTTPTIMPFITPSAAPSMEELIISDQEFFTQLSVYEQRKMDAVEQEFFRKYMESRTEFIGLNLTVPFIKTECTILQQELGKENNTTGYYLLQVAYLMNYTSRYGYEEIKKYPEYFRKYMNENRNKTHDSLYEKMFDPILVQSVGITAFVPDDVTIVSPNPTLAPTSTKPMAVSTTKPSLMNSMSPSESEMPSSPMPSIIAPPVSLIIPGGQTTGFLIGILVASSVVILSTVIAVFFLLHRKKLRRQEDANTTNAKAQHENKFPIEHSDRAAALEAVQDKFSSARAVSEISNSVAIRIDQSDVEAGTITTPKTAEMTRQPSIKGSSTTVASSLPNMFSSNMATTGVIYPRKDSMISLGSYKLKESNENVDGGSSIEQTASGTFVGANLLMRDRSESLSTDSFDGTISSQISFGDGDEFDKYKNSPLEYLRMEVESTIDDVEGMLSLAITRVFMDTERTLDLSWVGGEDLGSIEASSLYQAFEWMRKSKLLSGHSLFEDMLNKIVFIVHRGLIRPNDGARILHACASITGLPLLKELPNTTVIVQGLIKSNDLAHGHQLLVEAFSPFGDIVDASIAPQNRGFGFVRFVQQKTVEAVLKKHQMSEIEIQDVAVSIKAL